MAERTVLFELLNGKDGEATNTFALLSKCGIPTDPEATPILLQCSTRRIASGSYVERNQTPFPVKEGVKFGPPLKEFFVNDTLVSREQILAGFQFNGAALPKIVFDKMSTMQVVVFEILERAWDRLDCSLAEVSVKFGIDGSNKVVVVSVSGSAFSSEKRDTTWVASQSAKLLDQPPSRVVIFMGSASDREFCAKIQKNCADLNVKSQIVISSAHKAVESTLRILGEIEAENIPTVIVAVAGRSNGLGPVLSGNAFYPVINSPPPSTQWADKDVWSSLRLPSGLGCTTSLAPDTTGLMAAQVFAINDPIIFGALRTKRYNMWAGLQDAQRDAVAEK